MQSRWQQRHHGKLVIELVNLVLLRLSLEGDAVHAPSNVPVLPEGQPHPEHHLGSAKDPPLPPAPPSSLFRPPPRPRRFYNFPWAAFCELPLDGILRLLHPPSL